MAAIPGWVYAILGIVMILASELIKDTDGSKSLLLFRYVGIVFIIIGVGKYIFKSAFRKKKAPNHPAHRQPHHAAQHQTQARHARQSTPHHPQHKLAHLQGQHTVHRATPQQAHPLHPTQQSNILACPRCGARHYSYADFCMKCGTKLRK